MRLRSHLGALVIAAVAPLLVFTVLIVFDDVGERRDLLDRGMRDTVRALSLAAEREVNTSFAILDTLAASAALDAADLKGFHELCIRAIAGRKGAWIVLFDRTGQQMVNSSRPFGSALPNPFRQTKAPAADARHPLLPLGGAAPVRKVFETGRPVVSDLFVALDSLEPTIGVAIPVLRKGTVRYVLEMSVEPEALTRLLLDQRPPADSVVSLLDRRGLIIARTTDPARSLGTPLAPELAAQVASGEGSGVGRTREGMSVYHAFTRSKLTGWTTSLGVSQAVAGASMNDAIALLIGGTAIAVLVGVFAALVIGRRISAPISRLADSAGSIGRGERVELNVSAVRELEGLHRALVTAGEAARQGAAERERRLLAEAKEMQAHAADRAKDEFLATLSHELRNPLAGLTAAAHVLNVADPGGDASAKARGVIDRQTKHMTRLIEDLLDISRVTMGKARLEREVFNLADTVSEVIAGWRAAGRLSRHPLALSLAPVWVDADRARVEQILSNLLDNALKFTPAGGQLRVSLGRQDQDAVLQVADTGEGLAPDAVGRVFDLFMQVDQGRRGRGGLGLGLALVKRLVEMHGGAVSAASEGVGRGAVFTVRLPAVPKPERQAAPAPAQRAGLQRVLIIEDNDDARQMLHAALVLGGYEVSEARDGATGLAVAAETRPDVALIDIALPDIDGYEVARRLRLNGAERRMTLIALTGYGQPADERRAFEAGFDAHLTKPVAPEQVKQAIAAFR